MALLNKGTGNSNGISILSCPFISWNCLLFYLMWNYSQDPTFFPFDWSAYTYNPWAPLLPPFRVSIIGAEPALKCVLLVASKCIFVHLQNTCWHTISTCNFPFWEHIVSRCFKPTLGWIPKQIDLQQLHFSLSINVLALFPFTGLLPSGSSSVTPISLQCLEQLVFW